MRKCVFKFRTTTVRGQKNMSQKDIIINLYKQGCNHQQISDILKMKFGESTYKPSTIYKWMKEAKFNLPLANRRLDEEEAKNAIDEQLLLRIQQILEDEPFSSIRSIASVLNAPKSTIHRYMTVHLKLVYRHTRWLPHFLNNDQKNVRIQKCKKLLSIINSCKHYSFRNLITGDQSWFLYKYQFSRKWVLEGDENPIGDGSHINISKIMFTIIWGVWGFHIVNMAPNGTSYNSQYFIDNIIVPLNEKSNTIWPGRGRHKIWLHLDNCKVHNSRRTKTFISKSPYKRTPHPPYSPDIAPSDFFLFGYVKEKLKGHSFDTPEDLFEELTEILAQISHETLIQVFKEWELRCNWIIEHNGE